MTMVQGTVATAKHHEGLDCNDFQIDALQTTEQMRQASILLRQLLRVLSDGGCRVPVFLAIMNPGCASETTATQPLVQLVLENAAAESALPLKAEERANCPMTAREYSVLQLICQGLSNKKIARDLKIAPETVKSHTKHILGKLGTNTRAQAVAQAAKLGLL